MWDVAVVRYKKPFESLGNAVDLAGGLNDLSPSSKVLIKPNIVIWHGEVDFPKYGVLTTSRLIEDMTRLLRDKGISDITIAEGGLSTPRGKQYSMIEQAAKGLGLNVLKDRYGVKIIDIMKGRFTKVTKDSVTLSISNEVFEADYVINLPVLKTHTQAMVSLGIKNLKGTLNITSRKLCHNVDTLTDLHYHLVKLLDMISPNLTVIDGIYSNERGPMFTGRAHRANILVVSKDTLSADIVGSKILGVNPERVPYLSMAAKVKQRSTDLKDINIKGNVDIRTALKPHKWSFEQSEMNEIPLFFERAGIRGITFHPVDTTLCTYCALFIGNITLGILMAENPDKTFDDIEILYGKIQQPTPNHKHTLLLGNCQIKLNGKDPLINHCVKIPGCPAKRKDLLRAFRELEISLPDNFFESLERSPETIYMKKYINNPEFDPDFFMIK